MSLPPQARRQARSGDRRHIAAPVKEAHPNAPALDAFFDDAANLLGSCPSFTIQAAVEAAMDYLADRDEFMSRLEVHARSRLGRPRRQSTVADDTVFDALMVELMTAVQDRLTEWVRLDLPQRPVSRR